MSKITECYILNGEGSRKETRHIVFALGDSGLDYKVGDATFYTDSIHDLPLVEKCKNSIVVSPDDKLKAFALKNNIKIITR